MSSCRLPICAFTLLAAITGAGNGRVSAQTANPVDNQPNPYQAIDNYFKLPDGRTWGAVSAVEIDKDGTSLWVAERCGGNSNCMARPSVDPVLLFDRTGKLVRS